MKFYTCNICSVKARFILYIYQANRYRICNIHDKLLYMFYQLMQHVIYPEYATFLYSFGDV